MVFVTSHNAVTFHKCGSFFRDTLGLPQTLYFDGNISRRLRGSERTDKGDFMSRRTANRHQNDL